MLLVNVPGETMKSIPCGTSTAEFKAAVIKRERQHSGSVRQSQLLAESGDP
jgi:hypothetical protein